MEFETTTDLQFHLAFAHNVGPAFVGDADDEHYESVHDFYHSSYPWLAPVPKELLP